jgi:hypothetical protein
MTDDERHRSQETAQGGSPSETSGGSAQHEGAPSPSETDEKVADMEKGIERVDDRIEDAKEEADKATQLDPQPFSGNQGEQPNSTNP